MGKRQSERPHSGLAVPSQEIHCHVRFLIIYSIIHSSRFTSTAQAKSYKGEQWLQMLLAHIRNESGMELGENPGKATSSSHQVFKLIRNG